MNYRQAVYAAVAVACVLVNGTGERRALAQEARRTITIDARSVAQLRDWDQRLDGMLRQGELRVRTTREDTLIKGRTHQRSDQYYRGVRVFGGDVARQSTGGVTESVFGTLYEGIDVDPSPGFDQDRAREILQERTGVPLDAADTPELVVLPLADGRYALAYRLRITKRNDARQYFIDAHTGAALLDFSDRKTQSAVGRGHGVLGDTKKISVQKATGQFLTSDQLRPPAIQTY